MYRILIVEDDTDINNYLTKPYQLEELWARIGVQLRPSGTDSYIQTVWGIGFKLAEG